MKFLEAGIDYFTKWVEVEPLAKITQQNVKNFVWKNIICRFGVPRVLILENGRQFDDTFFRDFCKHFGIRQMKFLVVRIDYFTKWVETELLRKNHTAECQKFCLEEHCMQVWGT